MSTTYTADVEAGKTPPTAPVGGMSPEEEGVYPLDIHNAKLLDAVAPKDWTNPDRGEDFVYDIISIGAGAGGLVSSRQSARRGAKAALIEKHMAGGDCLNVGCVPSKALLRSARALRETKNHENAELGVVQKEGGNLESVDFAKIMLRLRKLRAHISTGDSYKTTMDLGVDAYQGTAKFTGPNTLEVGGKTLKFKKAVVSTGGRAFEPPTPGLKGTPYTTNANLFNLSKLPKSMVMIGAGPIGSEMAQAFATFGTKVTIIASRFLPKEDPEAAALVRSAMEVDGVNFDIGARASKVEYKDGMFKVWGGKDSVNVHECEVLLVAAGRVPNIEGIGLEAAGIEYTRKGVTINEFLQTSNPNVYAVGDVASKYQFTHMSGFMAGMACDNAIFGEKRSVNDLTIPWVTFTEPEVAHVGKYEEEIEGGCDTYTASLEHNDRAILEGTNSGFFKVHCAKGTDKILGGTICCFHAGEMLQELTLAIQFNIGLGRAGLGGVIHSYPTMSEGMAGVANSYKAQHWKKVNPDGTFIGGEKI